MTRAELLAVAKPISFNSEMVQAIWEERKSVTRRVVKMDRSHIYKAACSAGRWSETFSDEIPAEVAEWYAKEAAKPPYCPGDILWVRETFSPVGVQPIRYLYKCFCPEAEGLPVRWRPSRYMPKEAARLFSQVKSVRVEGLQEITPEECVCEGAVSKPHYMRWGGEKCLAIHSRYRCDFKNLWNSTIEPAKLPLYGWDANPWVWVIEFERVLADG